MKAGLIILVLGAIRFVGSVGGRGIQYNSNCVRLRFSMDVGQKSRRQNGVKRKAISCISSMANNISDTKSEAQEHCLVKNAGTSPEINYWDCGDKRY